MRRVLYGGGTFITGDAIAESLLDYARTLAATVRADTVHVPAWVDGAASTVELLVGPASQLMTEPVANGGPLEDAEFVEDLRRRSETAGRETTVSLVGTTEKLRFFDDL